MTQYNISNIDQITNEICEKFNENEHYDIKIYPNCEIVNINKIVVPIKIDDNTNNTINKFKYKQIKVEEHYYRNLIKIINDDKIIYAIKKSSGKIIENSLICFTHYLEIDKLQFPYCDNGISKIIKNIEILNIPNLNLELTELLIENNYFCINILDNKVNDNYLLKLKKELEYIYNFISINITS